MKDGWASHLITSLLTAPVGRPPPAILACLCVYDVNDFIRMSLETRRFFHAPMPRQSSPSPKQTLHLSLPSADSHAYHELHTLRPTIPRVAAHPARGRGHHPGSSPPPSLSPSSLHGFSLLGCCEWRRLCGPESSTRGWVDGRMGDGEAARRWACHHTMPPMNWSVGRRWKPDSSWFS